MKKFRLFLAAATLLLATAGVLAGSHSSKLGMDLYVSQDGKNFIKILSSGTFMQLQTTFNGSQVTVADHVGVTYGLYYSNSSTAGVYSNSLW